MPKIFRRLALQPIQYTKNTLKTLDLPKTVYKGLFFKWTVNHDNGAAPTLAAGMLLDMIKKLSVVINGQDVLVSVPFIHLWFMPYLETSYAPIKSVNNTASTNGLTSYVCAYLSFGLRRAVRPADTLLDARNVSTINIEAEFGELSSQAGDVTVQSATLDIFTEEYANVQPDAEFGRHEMSYISGNLDKTGVISVDLETGGDNQYRRLWIYTRGSNGLIDSTGTLLTNIGVKSRFFYYMNVKADMLRFSNSLEYAINEDTKGLYVVEFPSDGRMTERVDARNLSELVVELTSATTNSTYDIVKEKVIYRT